MTAYASLDDLAERFPRALTAAETDRGEILLTDASFWLAAWAPGLTQAVDGGDTLLAEAAKLLVVTMVSRSLITPLAGEGVDSTAVGPFSVRYRNPEGNLYLYGRELDAILALLMPNRAGAVSMRSAGL